MDEITRLLIERDCQRLALDYARLVDTGSAALVPALFTDDAVCELGPITLEGRVAITEFFERRQAMTKVVSRHVSTNITIDVHDDNTASGLVYLLLYRDDGSDSSDASTLQTPSFANFYEDTFVRTAAGWRFRSRRVRTP